MAPVVTMRQLLESGVHFGHQTRRWNPKMKRFILAERNGIYIIDLQQSLDFIDKAYEFIKETVAHGGTVLYVGTKKQAQEAIADQARRVGMPFVNQRWLGGMLTNFSTVHKRLQRLKELEEIDFEDVPGSGMTKKELLHLRRERDKLDRSLGGIKDMARVPSALWIVDTKKEHIAVSEARKLGIPVIAVLDTNCDPDEVDYPIPGNDDAIRSVSLLTRVVADAVADGLMARGAAGESDDKPAPAGDLGVEEPLAEWERDLLEHKTDANGTGPAAEPAPAPAAASAAAEATAPAGAPVETAAPTDAAATAAAVTPTVGTAAAVAPTVDTTAADTVPAVAPTADTAAAGTPAADTAAADTAAADTAAADTAAADTAAADTAAADTAAAVAPAADTAAADTAAADTAAAHAAAVAPAADTAAADTAAAVAPAADTAAAVASTAGTAAADTPAAGTTAVDTTAVDTAAADTAAAGTAAADTATTVDTATADSTAADAPAEAEPPRGAGAMADAGAAAVAAAGDATGAE